MRKINFFFLFLWSFILTACIAGAPVMYGNVSMVDACGFHVGQGGVGLQWSSLPVPLTLHERSMNKKSVDVTLKVIDEWNYKWNTATQQDQGLFEVIGFIESDSVFDVIEDQYNSVAILNQHNNRTGSLDYKSSQFLQSDKQGVTRVKGRMEMTEADIFINNDHFELFYDDEVYANQSSVDDERKLASSSSPRFEIKNILNWFLNLLTFWKKQDGRKVASRRIPSHMVDFESLITHELGHVLGLGHRNINGSVMKPRMKSGITRRGLRQVDLDSLLCGYAAK